MALQVPLSTDSPGKNPRVGCHFLLQGIFPTQGLNPCLFTSLALAGEVFTSSVTWEAHHASCFFLVTFLSHSVVSNFLQPHGLQHARVPVLHHLPEFAQIRVHRVGDAIQPSRPLFSSSAFSLSQFQGLFQSVGSLHQGAKVLKLQLQHQSFQ